MCIYWLSVKYKIFFNAWILNTKNRTELYSFTDTLKQLITENAFTCSMIILYHPLLIVQENPYTLHEVSSQKAFNSKVTDIHTLQ